MDDGVEVTLRADADMPRFISRALAAVPVQGISSESLRLHDLFVRAVSCAR